MITSVPRKLNLNNLAEVFARISHLEAFIFFGTLLGFKREGNIIAHDDDIDIYVNIRHLPKLLDALRDSDFNLKILPRKKWYRRLRRPLVVQATRIQDGIETFADFYLYDDSPADYLIEKWNFLGEHKKPESALHIPKSLIFPLQDADMQGISIKVPAHPANTCAFLYGSSWMQPVRKGEGYHMKIVNHAPEFTLKTHS